jgi:wobble nucleotide-excising tRNase
MLKQVRVLKNVGLFRDGTPAPVDLDRVTLIYGDNGRGKSSLASVMRASARNDAARVLARRTIDVTDAPQAVFIIERGAAQYPVAFNGTAWAATAPEFAVFDSEFVEENVYSGFEVRADQRQSLLDFALGEQAVLLKNKVDRLARDVEAATRSRTDAATKLGRFRGPYDLDSFVKLLPVANVDDQIAAQQKRIEAARKIQTIQNRAVPAVLPLPTLDVHAFFAILARNIQGIEQDAEHVVREHMAKHPGPGVEDWISRGQSYMRGDECPFCAQSLAGLDLVAAYRSYFNAAYADLKRQVGALSEGVGRRIGEGIENDFRGRCDRNSALIGTWREDVDVTHPPLDLVGLGTELTALRATLQGLALKKQQAPLDPLGSAQEEVAAQTAFDAVTRRVQDYNAAIGAVLNQLDLFKKQLAAENLQALDAELKKLEATKARQLPEVVALVAEHAWADGERARLDTEKTNTRSQLDALMRTTLGQYQTSINALLSKFGAGFTIGTMTHDYRGTGEPRMDYGLIMRAQPVRLGGKTDPHCFATTLSEGDKRTLAFAFFVAKLQNDPSIGDKIVVLDDPVCSLDSSRRSQTIHLTAEFCKTCKQVIVLAHNAYFLRDLSAHLALAKPAAIVPCVLGINRVAAQYSIIGAFDLEAECASEHYRNHVLVSEFVDGTSTANKRDVAKAIRPLLEGYLHRRFPRDIAKRQMFGQILGKVRAATAPSPLIHLQPLVQELAEINDYAGQFHHDTNPANADSVAVADGELLNFTQRALSVIYRGTP